MCDYQNKRLKVATREVKEWMRGQRELGVDLEGKPTGYLGARVSKRLCTDLFARGVCRGAVECANLLLHAESKDPTSAESIKTAPLTETALAYPMQLLQAVRAQEHWPKETTRAIVDKRCDTARKITDCPPWTAYGARGRHPKAPQPKMSGFATQCNFLSPHIQSLACVYSICCVPGPSP